MNSPPARFVLLAETRQLPIVQCLHNVRETAYTLVLHGVFA